MVSAEFQSPLPPQNLGEKKFFSFFRKNICSYQSLYLLLRCNTSLSHINTYLRYGKILLRYGKILLRYGKFSLKDGRLPL